ncbi:MAG: restriction endonuclease subunit S [Burkholderiales bacterium]|jgi:type I restriction enzyme S subunit|nr:restriction endonuclease subunit S [Burkholderiales bacterium]
MKITQNREACDAQHQGTVVRKGWQVKTIGDVCEFQRGLTYAKGDEVDVSGNIVLRATNIDLATNLLIFGELKYISEKVVVPESKKVKKGSLLICMASGSKSHLGKVAFIDDDYGYAFGGFMGMLTPLNGLSPKYLFYLMTSEGYKDFIAALSDGANINNLTFEKLKVFSVPVPPLTEQHRIVAILYEAFESIAIAKANTEKNLQNARVLFESHLESIFTERGEGWVEKRLGDVCAIFSTLVDPRKEDFIDLIHVGAGNIQSQTGVFVDLKTAREEGLISGKFLFDESMVLYSKIRPYLMKAARPDFNGLCSADMYPLSPLHNQITRDYLFHLLLSKPFTDYAIRGSARAGMPKVNREHLFEFRAWLPRVKKQMEQTAILDALHDETQRLAYLYQKKLTALDDLKKSLLHQAFSGAL